MIRFSAILVAGAIAVLVAGVLDTSLALVYLSIGVSVLARKVSDHIGTPTAFLIAVVGVVVWAAVGPIFGFSDRLF